MPSTVQGGPAIGVMLYHAGTALSRAPSREAAGLGLAARGGDVGRAPSVDRRAHPIDLAERLRKAVFIAQSEAEAVL